MFKTFVFLLVVLVNIASSDESTPPSWMHELNVLDDMIVGYGEGKTMAEAKANARSSIAYDISTKVSDETVKNEHLDNTEFSKTIDMNTRQTADVELTGLNTLRSEKKDGTYYVALEYDGRSLRNKIKSSIVKGKKLKTMESNNPYAHTYFAEELKDIFPHQSNVPDYDVVYSKGVYKLILADEEFNLGQDDIEDFLFNYDEPSFNLSIVEHTENGYRTSKRLQEGSYFHLDIRLSRTGYLTLLSVDEEGKVSVMFDNEEISSEQTKTFPDLELYEGLRTEILSREMSSMESFVAVLCERPQSYTHFEEITEEVNTNKQSRRFPRLYMDIQSCKFTSMVLKTNR
ncbi:MAG: LPP20 family lipoprotein [Sulfurimonadaceae bacterium]